MDHAEIGVALGDAAANLGLQRVAAIDQEIERHADREVAAQGRIHRHHDELHPVARIGVVLQHAVEDRLAVFGLADLEEGRVGRRLDEIAGGIDLEQPHAAPLELPAEEDRDIELDLLRLERRPVAAIDAPHRLAGETGRSEHARHRVDVVDAAFGLDPFVQHVDDRLRDAEVAGRHGGDEALAGDFVDMHLREGRDIVDARIGARIGQHHESVFEA